jgi:hypothetical protein
LVGDRGFTVPLIGESIADRDLKATAVDRPTEDSELAG